MYKKSYKSRNLFYKICIDLLWNGLQQDGPSKLYTVCSLIQGIFDKDALYLK